MPNSKAMINEGVSAALAARDATRNGTDSHSSGTGVRGSERVARECTYQDFMKCKPLYFKSTRECALTSGIPNVIHIYIMIFAYSMTWVDLRKKMTDKYCPRNEMKKLEAELWNLKVIGNANNTNNQKGTGSGQKLTCFECGVQGHFQKDCPRLKNNKGNRGNQAGNDRAPAKYSQIDITPSTLDHYYDVELADGRIIGLNTILKGCTLNFLNHQFHVNLMPENLVFFDAIDRYGLLAKYQAGSVTRLNIISCTKAQKYMEKGFPVFLADITTKEVEDK
ncbi:putative reverse transcriptase domain-containing protein [Tanacetum coccineum]